MFTLKNITQDLTYSQDFTEFKRGVKISIPMLLGIIPFALVLGAQATQKGFSFIYRPQFCRRFRICHFRIVDQSTQYFNADVHYFFSQ